MLFPNNFTQSWPFFMKNYNSKTTRGTEDCQKERNTLANFTVRVNYIGGTSSRKWQKKTILPFTRRRRSVFTIFIMCTYIGVRSTNVRINVYKLYVYRRIYKFVVHTGELVDFLNYYEFRSIAYYVCIYSIAIHLTGNWISQKSLFPQHVIGRIEFRVQIK